MHNEIWKDIKGYEGVYQVSNFGSVKVLPRYFYSKGYPQLRREHILTQSLTGKYRNYPTVTLTLNGVRKHYTVHRLVAESFIPNPDNLPCVNHKDENPSNNNVDNLEWCTNRYNVMYGTGIERAKLKLKNRKFTDEHKQHLKEAWVERRKKNAQRKGHC